jgi:hypothetical protein
VVDSFCWGLELLPGCCELVPGLSLLQNRQTCLVGVAPCVATTAQPDILPCRACLWRATKLKW